MNNKQLIASLKNKVVEFEYKGIMRIVHLIPKPDSQGRKWGNRDGALVTNGDKLFLAGREIYKDGFPIDAWKSYDFNKVSKFKVKN